MQRDLTLREVAEITGFSYKTIYENRHKIRAYQINPTPKGHWRVKRENIDNLYKVQHNVVCMRLASEELETCQSTEIKTQDTGTLICQQRAASELDALLAQPTKPKRKSFMTA